MLSGKTKISIYWCLASFGLHNSAHRSKVFIKFQVIVNVPNNFSVTMVKEIFWVEYNFSMSRNVSINFSNVQKYFFSNTKVPNFYQKIFVTIHNGKYDASKIFFESIILSTQKIQSNDFLIRRDRPYLCSHLWMGQYQQPVTCCTNTFLRH